MFKMEEVSDVLGSEGRKALNACVKVKNHGRPETQKYNCKQALDRLRPCFEGVASKALFYHLESKYFMLDESGGPIDEEKIVDIFDIHNALVRCDELPYVEKYPRPGPRCDEMKKLIDGRRAAIETKCQEETKKRQETTQDPEQYSWLVARRLVRDCFGWGFPRDEGFAVAVSGNRTYSTHDIIKFVVKWEYLFSPDICEKLNVKENSFHCSARHFRDMFYIVFTENPCEDPHCGDSNNIFIDQEAESFARKEAIKKYLDKDSPGSGVHDLKWSIDECKSELQKELEKETNHGSIVTYSLIEAERRVRDCFARPGPVETDVFLSVKKGREEEVKVSKANQTYNIFEIKSAVDRLDSKKLGDLLQEGTYETAIKARAEITEEYSEASQKVEIDHGSGIIVHEHFVVTNKHVVEDVIDGASREVHIFNAAIGECSCEVVHYDARKDLALLCVKDGLNLTAKNIPPLQLCSQSLLPGMQIFAFGFPMSHTGETALFVTGHVSGSKKNYNQGQTFAVLNCSLNGGNSGGPILCWVRGQLKVVGVAMEKHIKEILSLDERLIIEKIRESYQTSTISGVSDEQIRSATSSNSDPRQIPLNLLTLKLYNALETHSQFNLSNAVPGRDVIDFIKDALSKYNGQHKEELSEILQWSDTYKPGSVHVSLVQYYYRKLRKFPF